MAAAISVIDSAEVLVARTTSGGQVASRSAKVRILTAMSSGTASITKSASATALSSVWALRRAKAAVGVRGGELAAGDAVVEVLADLGERAVEGGRGDVVDDGAEAAHRGHVRDPAAHQPRTDDGDGLDAHERILQRAPAAGAIMKGMTTDKRVTIFGKDG